MHTEEEGEEEEDEEGRSGEGADPAGKLKSEEGNEADAEKAIGEGDEQR